MIFVVVVALEVSRSQPRCLFAFLSLVGFSHALLRVGRRTLSSNFFNFFLGFYPPQLLLVRELNCVVRR
jgi:hypothetical protein